MTGDHHKPPELELLDSGWLLPVCMLFNPGAMLLRLPVGTNGALDRGWARIEGCFVEGFLMHFTRQTFLHYVFR